MKYLFLLSILSLGISLRGQDKATYYHDGEHHFLVDGIDVSHKTPSILLSDAIMFEYDAKIYLIKQTDAVKGTGKKIEGTLINDRTELKGWGIDFYTKMGESFVIYFNGSFQNPDQFFLGVDNTAYGYVDSSYFRLNNYEKAEEGVFEEVFVYQDGIWWRDAPGDLYGLRNGEPFKGDVEIFSKGVIAKEEQTNEYIWFADYSGKAESNKVHPMEVISEAIVINLSTGSYSFIGQFFFQGKPLDGGSIEREMDDDKTIYYFDSELGRAFYGEITQSGQTMDVIEIDVPISESKAYWISDRKGQTYLQFENDIWQEYLEKKGNDKISATDRTGNFYKYSGPAKMKPYVLYPAKIYR